MSATTRTRLAVVAVDAAPAPFDSSVGMFEGIRVVVVVPAYDEERHLRAVLAGLPAWVDSALVVDDASRDGTRRVAREVAALDGRVRLLCHPSNRGVGAAIVTGYREGAALHPGERVALVVMAGDGQMSPADLPALVAPIAADAADYVKGNRFARPSIAQMPRDRYLGSLVFSRLTAAATGLPIHDSQCGYTALSGEACAALDLDTLWPGFGYPNDLLGQLAVRGLRVAEVPVEASYADETSKLRWRHLPAIAWLVGRALWRRRGREPRRR
ncbi:MAG TPA: glycosyltransferase family 2 protein [Polyangiaceae bacterium]|nr:glycosyltransferase family 2 protein [Polyangiaceae bacterium]